MWFEITFVVFILVEFMAWYCSRVSATLEKPKFLYYVRFGKTILPVLRLP